MQNISNFLQKRVISLMKKSITRPKDIQTILGAIFEKLFILS